MMLIPSKMNMAPLKQGMAYRIEGCLVDGEDEQIITSRIMYESTPVNVTADQVLGFSAGAGQDSVTMLDNLATQVSAGNATGVSASIAGVDVALGRVNQGLAQIGSAGNRIDAALALNLNNAETIKSQLSSVQDVDLAEATMNLQTQQVAYQAALGALSKVLGPSLLDFIPRG